VVIIGIGRAGCNVCDSVSKISNIRTVKLDGGVGLPKCETHEEYDKSVPKLARKLKLKDTKKVWLVVCGAGRVSGATLGVLEQLKPREINVAFIHADPFFCPPHQQKQNKVVFNVLQEYARSGLINSLYLFSNKHLEAIVGEESLSNYFDKINDAIANAIVSIDHFRSTDPIMGAHHDASDISRIRTVSLKQLSDEEENFYFPLDNVTESCYLYSVASDEIKNNKNLLTTIRKQVILDKERGVKSSFGVFENSSDYSYFYSLKFTHYIQKEIE